MMDVFIHIQLDTMATDDNAFNGETHMTYLV